MQNQQKQSTEREPGLGASAELKTDHDRLRRLLRQWEGEQEGSKREGEIIDKCLEIIEIHSRIEQELFYPECQRVWMSSFEFLDEAIDDHRKADSLVAEIRSKPRDARSDHFGVLMNDLMSHFEEEEREILPRYDNVVSDHESRALGDRLRSRKAELFSSSGRTQERRVA